MISFISFFCVMHSVDFSPVFRPGPFLENLTILMNASDHIYKKNVRKIIVDLEIQGNLAYIFYTIVVVL